MTTSCGTLRAEGRDVLVEEDRLDYHPATRTLALAGAGSRKQTAKTKHLDELLPTVMEAVRADPGVSGYGIAKTLRADGVTFSKGDESKAAMLAVERGLLRFETGSRNAKHYFPAPTSPTSLDLPDRDVPRPPRPPFIGEGREVVGGGDASPPQPLDLGHLPGRCHLCEFHVQTQGHRTGCADRSAAS